MTWVDAADASLPDQSVLSVEAGQTIVALARSGGRWHAVDAWCTHAECPLSDGWVEGVSIRCPCHGSRFDLRTGEAVEGPAEEPVRVYATRILDGRVEIELA
jgi:nitrite reductase/ring-hydroxylating ferredoxin subunit